MIDKKLQEQLDRIEAMLKQLLYPAESASIADKARLISEAVASGDKKRLRETMRLVNGE